MSDCEIKMTDEGFSVGSLQYWRLEAAASLVGLHPQSLNRVYRFSASSEEDRPGLKIGRTLFFNASHMAELGYPVTEVVNA